MDCIQAQLLFQALYNAAPLLKPYAFHILLSQQFFWQALSGNEFDTLSSQYVLLLLYKSVDFFLKCWVCKKPSSLQVHATGFISFR